MFDGDEESWKISCLVYLDIYDPVHPSYTRTGRYLHRMELYEITPAHYPLSPLLLHPYYSTFRDPSLRLVPMGAGSLEASWTFS